MKPATNTAEVVPLPGDTKARRARQLNAKWAKLDDLERQVRELRREIAPLQREVSLDRGYLFAVSREAPQRPGRVR